ncbi:MAG: HAMP domain-containing protein [Burkholderiales bacterium]|nr:HAMP domain-containing protein [Burkholderiales bacterium]
MLARLKALLFDTLAKRLAWLMWGALVVSHLAAYAVFHAGVSTAPAPPADPQGWERAAPPGAWQGDEPGPADAPRERRGPSHPRPSGEPPPRAMPTFPSLPPTPGLPDSGHRALPTSAFVLDYGVRLAVIALAAVLGARWLARPLHELARASRGMALQLRKGQTVPRLSEASGTREVRELAHAFNDMGEQLRRQYEGRSLMVAAISHDLRTPLTRLRMRLETQDDLERLRTQGVADLREMSALIDSVLQVFQPSAASTESARPVKLAPLVQALVDDAQALGHDVQLLQPVPDLSLRVPPLALRRVLDNLVGNAVRYGQRARIGVTESAGRIGLVVEDDGPGIPEALHEAVFEPFVRVESSRHRASGGVGLGLYIARQLAEGMDAELRLHNRPEGGLRAQLSF